MSRRHQFLGTLAAIAASILGGSAIVATRLAVNVADPLAFAVLRYMGAGAVILVVTLVSRRGRLGLTISGLGPVLALGLLQFGVFGWLFTAALAYVPAARGALVLATMPILTLALAALLGRERLTVRSGIGAAAACAGVALALGDRTFATGPDVWKGDALMFAAALVGSTYNVLTGLYSSRFPPLTMTAVQIPVGGAALFVALAVQGDFSGLTHFTPAGWIAVIYVMTLGGAGSFFLWIWALERIAPSRVAVTVTLNPVAAALLGAVVLGEEITWGVLVGLVGVVAGIALANRPSRASGPRSAAEPGLRPGVHQREVR
jgi:drug/metabolite transporter (DMT)-like permease